MYDTHTLRSLTTATFKGVTRAAVFEIFILLGWVIIVSNFVDMKSYTKQYESVDTVTII